MLLLACGGCVHFRFTVVLTKARRVVSVPIPNQFAGFGDTDAGTSATIVPELYDSTTAAAATTNTAAVAGQVLYDSAPGLNGFAGGDATGAPPAIATMDVYGSASVKARKKASGRSKSSRSNPPRPASGQDVDFDMPGDVDL